MSKLVSVTSARRDYYPQLSEDTIRQRIYYAGCPVVRREGRKKFYWLDDVRWAIESPSQLAPAGDVARCARCEILVGAFAPYPRDHTERIGDYCAGCWEDYPAECTGSVV